MSDLIDTGLAPEFYVDDLGSADDLGTNCRANYFTYSRMPGGLFERVIVVKIIRPKRSIVRGKLETLLALNPLADIVGGVLN